MTYAFTLLVVSPPPPPPPPLSPPLGSTVQQQQQQGLQGPFASNGSLSQLGMIFLFFAGQDASQLSHLIIIFDDDIDDDDDNDENDENDENDDNNDVHDDDREKVELLWGYRVQPLLVE